MKESVTQESGYGCGVACFAFVCGMTYQQAVLFLEREYSVKHGWRPSDLVYELKRFGKNYNNNYVRKKFDINYKDGSIVLIEKSPDYPVGHYLVICNGRWMDPWINLPQNNELSEATSGYRSQLPGKAMYALIPQ